MKFYIASSFKNTEQVRKLSNELKLRGHIHSYDWTQNERANSLKDLATIGELEKAAVMESDFVVILLPGGKGTHIELGIAIGLGKKVYLYSPTDDIYDYDKTSTFYHIQGVGKFVGTYDSFVQYLVEVCNEESMDLT